jgi:hypothetical protein
MFDLLSHAHMPSTPMFNPRLQRSGSSHIPYDIRNFLTQMTSMGGVHVQGRFHAQPHERNRQDEGNASTSQPILHPLLAVSDPRQAREIFSSSNPPGRSQAMMDHILSAIDSQGPFGNRSFNTAQQRMEIAERRRLLHPFVCDRRWGTDLGELELVGGRVKSLVDAFRASVDEMIEKKSRSTGEDSKEDLDDQTGLWMSSRSQSPIERARRSPRVSPPASDSIPEFSAIFPTDAMELSLADVPPETTEDLPCQRNIPTPLMESDQLLDELPPTSADHSLSVPSATEMNQTLIDRSAEASSTVEPVEPDLTQNTSPPETATTPALASIPDEESNLPPENNLVSTSELNSVSSTNPTEEISALAPIPTDEPLAPVHAPINCPDGIDPDVWDSLPLEVQLELVGTSEDAALNIPQDDASLLESTELDRDTLAQLPPEMRTEILRDEAVVRMRRQSFDESGNLRTPSENTPTAAPQVNYGETFLASLPAELREDALLSADETFLSTLPPAIQAEARELRRSHSQINLAPGLLFWGNESSGRANRGADVSQIYRTLGNIEESRRPARRPPLASISAPARRTNPKSLVDLALTSLNDNTSPISKVPFGRHLPFRLLLQLYTTRRARLPKPLLKLMVGMSQYRVCRKPILEAIVAMMFHDVSGLSRALTSVRMCDDSEETSKLSSGDQSFKSRNRTSSSLHSDDITSLIQVVSQECHQQEPLSPVVLRRLLNAIYYLCKKTDKLAWFDVMHQVSEHSSESKARKWIFGQLLELLIHPSMASNANIDMILHVVQELLEDFSKLTIPTVNALIARRDAPRGEEEMSKNAEGGSGSWDRSSSKRQRPTENTEGAQDSLPVSENKSEGMEMAQETNESPPTSSVPETGLRPPFSIQVSGVREIIRCDLPFPVLDDHTANILAGLVHYENCGGAFPSRLSRILNTLSLHDRNWTKLLECLRGVSEEVALLTINEARYVKSLLCDIVNENGTASSAMSVPYLSTPSSVSELRLLHVLRLLTTLRQTKEDETEEEHNHLPASQTAVSAIIKRVDFQDLWDLLVGSLDMVRKLEGIVEPEVVENLNSQTKDKENTPTLSALTMRFVPLIECYLTVCGSTLLKTIDEIQSTPVTEETDGQSSSNLKRIRSDDDSVETAAAPPSTELREPSLKIKKDQMPGLRFRQTPEFRRMQQDLEDNVSARRLLSFVEKNNLLLNMVLKQNVNLLESSFSPLIQIPKCRALLHFDIKRAFFKMKLKKMKRNTQRPLESSRLRLSVRRQNIFEESFQKLRFCSAAEMRRPVSVTFHGEDGIDAGGVTREWYSELAKEIFNANYCLFDNATHDNVTFQPNPYSHINSHHLDYFKFVGRIIGKAICDGQLLDVHFTRSFYKHILGVQISYHDMEATEPEYYKSLVTILEHPLDLLGLDLTFTAELNEVSSRYSSPHSV